MRFKKYEKRQCSAIVQPGEYTTDVWDNKQCTMDHLLTRCDYCDQFFCVLYHYHDHVEKERQKDEETSNASES